MVNKNGVMLSMVGAVIVGSGFFCNFAFADNPQESEFSVTIAASETLVIPDSPVNLVVTPNANGVFSSGSFNVTAYTNNPDGYYVTMTTNNTALTSNTANVNTGTFPTIATLSANATESTFELNKWGISLDGGENYLPMVASKEIMNEDEATSAQGDVQAIGYATKLDLATVPGTYSTTIGFTITPKIVDHEWKKDEDGDKNTCHSGGAIGDDSGSAECSSGPYFPANSLLRALEVAYVYNNKPIYVADDATNTSWHLMQDGEQVGGGKQVRFAMQDIDLKFVENGVTYSVCDYAAASNRSNSYIDEALVMDLRDGKSYWIAKLEDGKCWMTQNLDHDISTTGTYNDINTDLGWNSTTRQYPSQLAWDAQTQTYSNTPSVTWAPASGTVSPVSSFGYSETGPRSADPGNWYQLASLAADNTTECDYTDGNTDCSGYFTNTRSDWEDLHRHVGNFYNVAAGMATNTAQVDDNPNDPNYYPGDDFRFTTSTSICPRGWRIAYTGYDYYTGGNPTNFNDFYTLNNIYNNGSSSSISGLAGAPTWFIRAGSLRDSGTMWNPGVVTAFNSSIYAGGEDSTSFLFDGSSLSVSGYMLYSSAGQSVRCIARSAQDYAIWNQ